MKPLHCLTALLTLLVGGTGVRAHDLSDAETPHGSVRAQSSSPRPDRLPLKVADAAAQRLGLFSRFGPKVRATTNATHWIVESDGMPDHRMMVGITAWQQQVPLPQPYVGDNAWRIPRFPVPAAQPLSAKDHFFRGAIAMAVNGVPIFNPIKNDGRTDTFLAGELDEFGGHCGRADDYHYHIAPTHLQEQVGPGQPIAIGFTGLPNPMDLRWVRWIPSTAIARQPWVTITMRPGSIRTSMADSTARWLSEKDRWIRSPGPSRCGRRCSRGAEPGSRDSIASRRTTSISR